MHEATRRAGQQVEDGGHDSNLVASVRGAVVDFSPIGTAHGSARPISDDGNPALLSVDATTAGVWRLTIQSSDGDGLAATFSDPSLDRLKERIVASGR
jgi:hypothetical protein